MDPTITEAELIAAIEAAMVTVSVPDKERGVTTQELCDALGWSEKRVRKALRRLQLKDRLDTDWAGRPNLVGSVTYRPVYKLKAESGGNDG